MDTPAVFRKYASDCETMAKVSKDLETKAVWKGMVDRWLLCAKSAENEDLSLRRQLEERRSKPHRNPHAWEGVARQA